ncbi:MAG: tetratricopeptide repeat protein [Deltaproteobacteria bacterium]|nr:tetratricopeptide repeat protein [Deltaproteobacteria bacterium]MBK8236256.1 tetratricopeptide repeat protein [Deltaproteobacteria bacterium]
MHSALRERDAAVDAYRNALQIKQARLGAEHPEVAAELSNLGTALLAVGSYAEARTLGERALAIRERVFGSEHAQVAQSLHLLGLVALESGDPAAAVPGLERALGLYTTHQSDPHDQASAQLGLARALVATHGDRARALELARSAARTYRAAGASKAEALAEAEAWLAAHG